MSLPVHFRAMTAGDLEAVMRIEVSSYSHPWSRGNFQDSLLAGHEAQVLEAADGCLVGYSVAMRGVDELHLLNLTVAREARGCGHGLRLLEALARSARQQGAQAIWLEVRSGNPAAIGLYRRFGFEQVGLRRDYYPAHHGREDAVLMNLALHDATVGR
jgi:[ribosomal protein S18]-alanine N-acetyltransferase